MKKAICFGTFDLLHLGHINYFQQAKKYGGFLIVIVARDKTTVRLGKKTKFSENERLELIQNIEIVDEVVLGYEGNFFKIIEEKKPDVICLGYDQKIKEEDLRNKLSEIGLHPEIKRMNPFHPEKYKSGLIKEN